MLCLFLFIHFSCVYCTVLILMSWACLIEIFWGHLIFLAQHDLSKHLFIPHYARTIFVFFFCFLLLYSIIFGLFYRPMYCLATNSLNSKENIQQNGIKEKLYKGHFYFLLKQNKKSAYRRTKNRRNSLSMILKHFFFNFLVELNRRKHRIPKSCKFTIKHSELFHKKLILFRVDHFWLYFYAMK